MTLSLTKSKKQRIWELDFLRGMCVFFMFFDHFIFDMYYMMPEIFSYQVFSNSPLGFFIPFGIWYWEESIIRKVVRYGVLFLFFTISGVSTNFSKSNIKRGAILIYISLAFAVLSIFYTNLVENVAPFNKWGLPSLLFIFPIFYVYGVSLFSYGLIKWLYFKFIKNPRYFKYICLVIGLTLTLLAFYFNPTLELNVKTYNNSLFWDFISGKYYPAYHMDAWPLLPYVGLIYLGGFLSEILYKNKKSILVRKGNVFTNKIAKPILFLGRNAIFCYILQQIPIMILALIISSIAIYL